MKKLIASIALTAAVAVTAAAQVQRPHANGFASDLQTVPVMANLPGFGGTFQSYLALLNPTASAFTVTATLYDGTGNTKTASIPLNAGEAKTYQNFLNDAFGYTGGGAVVFSAPATPGGTHNNRFIITSEVRTGGTRYSTSIPALEFAGSNSRSFAPGVSVDANTRTNVGCFNQAGNVNNVAVTVLDAAGGIAGTTSMTLAASGWGQAPINSTVSNGTIQFDPSDNAVCYAVVVDNVTNDGRFIQAPEYQP